jgi:LssY C-terminus
MNSGHPAVKRRSRTMHLLKLFAFGLAIYLAIAYVLVPFGWISYTRHRPSLENIPGITHTKTGIHGDPLNVALIGSEHDLKSIMLAAKWFPADPITLRSSWKIASDTIRRRPYPDAPVSNLYLFGRKEDLAFEQPVGHDPRQRQHVRFWKTDKLDDDGRPVWVGAATYDRAVGLSHTTGEITHHIDGDIDKERDQLMSDLAATGDLTDTYSQPDFHSVHEGKNGGGDRWHTDGALKVGVIKPFAGDSPAASEDEAPVQLQPATPAPEPAEPVEGR